MLELLHPFLSIYPDNVSQPLSGCLRQQRGGVHWHMKCICLSVMRKCSECKETMVWFDQQVTANAVRVKMSLMQKTGAEIDNERDSPRQGGWGPPQACNAAQSLKIFNRPLPTPGCHLPDLQLNILADYFYPFDVFNLMVCSMVRLLISTLICPFSMLDF